MEGGQGDNRALVASGQTLDQLFESCKLATAHKNTWPHWPTYLTGRPV